MPEYKGFVLWENEDIFNKAFSENDFYKQLGLFDHKSDNVDDKDRIRVLNEAFGYVDGKNAKRICKEIFNFKSEFLQ